VNYEEELWKWYKTTPEYKASQRTAIVGFTGVVLLLAIELYGMYG
jgi:hypothetical protein